MAGAAIGALAGFAAGSVLAPPAPQGPVYVYEGHRHAPYFGGDYVWPSGYAYREMDVGAVLPSAFVAQPYFIDNYDYYGLSAPPPQYRWVRYGPDMVLVRLVDDAVVKVVKGVFVAGHAPLLASASATVGTGWFDPEELPGDLPPPGVMPQ